MNILITGVAGFLGTNLSKYLLNQGHTVIGVDNFLTGTRENTNFLKKQRNFFFMETGVETNTFLREYSQSIYSFDVIYHLACPTGVPNIRKLGEEMIDACSTGTKNVLHIARIQNAKLLFTSSSEIYGDPEISPQQESYTGNVDPQGVRASYEEGKRFSESLLALFWEKYGTDVRTVRLFNAYGPHMNIEDQRVIPSFLRNIIAKKDLEIYGDGSQRRTLCFSLDIIRGLELAITKGEPGGIYNLGGDEEMSIGELAESIISLTGSTSKILFKPAFIQDHKQRKPSLERIKSLGWKQNISLREGLQKTILYFKRHTNFQNKFLNKQIFPWKSSFGKRFHILRNM
jgi:nucleoside-diphosphate-sugar epimerase